MTEKLGKRRIDGEYDGKIDGDHYVYRHPDGSISAICVVERHASSCAACGDNNVRDKGSFYACNTCGHRGDHGTWLVPVEALPQDGESIARRGHTTLLGETPHGSAKSSARVRKINNR